MNKLNTRETDTLFSASHPYIHIQTSIYQIILSLLVALGGVVSIVFAFQLDVESDASLSIALLTLGVILLIFAIYRFSWKSTDMIYQPTGSIVRKGTLYMDVVELQHIQDMMKKMDFSNTFHLSFKSSGVGRIDYMISQDGRFVALQLLCFVPYTYEPVTEKTYYTEDEAFAVARCMGLTYN